MSGDEAFELAVEIMAPKTDPTQLAKAIRRLWRAANEFSIESGAGQLTISGFAVFLDRWAGERCDPRAVQRLKTRKVPA